jgi:hypothetical protein
MARFYVEITGLAQEFLDFLGYTIFEQDKDFKILIHKDDKYIIDKKGKQYLFVDDKNDAALLQGAFLARKRIIAPEE